MMFFLLIEFFIVLWVGNLHLVYFLALISLLGFLFLLYSCGIFFTGFLDSFPWWFCVFSSLDLRGADFINCVPLWIGFCTISFQGRKETFQKFKCFLELSRGGVGRNGAKEISRCISFLLANDCFWVLKSDCSSWKGWLVEGYWGICILEGILQVEASAGCFFFLEIDALYILCGFSCYFWLIFFLQFC